MVKANKKTGNNLESHILLLPKQERKRSRLRDGLRDRLTKTWDKYNKMEESLEEGRPSPLSRAARDNIDYNLENTQEKYELMILSDLLGGEVNLNELYVRLSRRQDEHFNPLAYDAACTSIKRYFNKLYSAV